MTLRALLFDAGDVLYHRPHKNQFLIPFLHDLGLDPNQVDQIAKRDLQMRAWCGAISYADYQPQFLRLHGVPDEHIARGLATLEREEESVEFFDGVRETLHELRARGFLLGVITDTATPEKIKMQRFARGGFGDVWSVYVSSCAVGVRKPDPRMYTTALDALNLRADESVFVGHKPRELVGARAVGMKTAAFNYDANAPADIYLEHFSELLKVSAILFPENKSV